MRYLELVADIDPRAYAPVRRLLPLLRVPGIGARLFRAACRRYCLATSRRRSPALDAESNRERIKSP
jgi:hypothetical protein